MRSSLIALLLPAALEAQVIVRGRVVDAATRNPIGAVQINAAGPASARALSDSAGWFRLDLPASGNYSIMAERIGYARIAQTLTTTLREDLIIEIRLAPDAVPLQPITVVARNAAHRTGLDGFYARAEWADKIGIGTILRRAELAKRPASRGVQLFTAATGSLVRGDTVRFRRGVGGQPCRPTVYLDGVRGQPGVVDVETQSLEGVEIYRGAGQTPAEFQDPAGCGVILLWTRRSGGGDRPFKRWHLLAVAGFVLAVVAVAR